MATTRHTQSLHVYQEMNNAPSRPTTAQKPRPQLQPSAMPLQPVKNGHIYQAVSVQPPTTAAQTLSPVKHHTLPHNIPQYNQMGFVPMPAPTHGHMLANSPVKSDMVMPSHTFHPAMSQPMFGTFDSNLDAFQQDHFHVPLGSQNESADFPPPHFPARHTLKRSLSDVASLQEKPTKRFRVDEDTPPQIPDPTDMPLVEDDGGKPGYSYAQMIGMAILRAPHRRLTLAQIYDWIATTFAYYREDPKQGWHNSIRHNLSLNKAFTKQERPKGDAGKGSYWIIEPGMELQFCREKARKSNNIGSIALHQNQAIQVMAQPLAEAMTPSWSVSIPPPPSQIPSRPQTAPVLPELSSDATLPASDPALNDEDIRNRDATSEEVPSSPVAALNSSPPQMSSKHQRTVSSPVNIRAPPTRAHRRSATAFDDSGYFTDLTSSVRRPKATTILPSDVDVEKPRKARGRAEEEIHRIRSSPHPHATPNLRRFTTIPDELNQSSSPMKPSPSVHLHPATPAVMFKKPCRPPPSVSPNTQLQLHRQMMSEFRESPLKGASLFVQPDLSPPKVDSAYRSQFDDAFVIHEDLGLFLTPKTPAYSSSPFKSVKRPGIMRSNTSAGVLTDMSHNPRVHSKTPSKAPSLKPSTRFTTTSAGSPLKRSVVQIHEDEDVENIFASDAFAHFDDSAFVDFPVEDENAFVNDENSSEAGDGHFDLSKGFANIGDTQGPSAPPMKAIYKTSRPALGPRSNTSIF